MEKQKLVHEAKKKFQEKLIANIIEFEQETGIRVVGIELPSAEIINTPFLDVKLKLKI